MYGLLGPYDDPFSERPKMICPPLQHSIFLGFFYANVFLLIKEVSKRMCTFRESIITLYIESGSLADYMDKIKTSNETPVRK